MWSRRQFLGALTASGASCALAPLLGCGAQRSTARVEVATALEEEHLLSALSILDARLDNATICSRIRTTHHISVDHEEEQYQLDRQHLVVLSGARDGTNVRVALYAPTRDELLLAATSLSESEVARTLALRPLVRLDLPAPVSRELSDYRAPVRRVFAEAQKYGSSRIIYRSSYLHAVHTEQRFLSQSQNLRTESQRTRAGLVMAAWAGHRVATGSVELSDSRGPQFIALSSDALAEVADDTLAHLHARSAPSGAQEVLLSPEAAAMVAHQAVAQTRAVLPSAHEGPLRIVDDPTLGYGALVIDDEGRRCEPHILVGPGAFPGPMSNRRRYDDRAQLRLAPSHVQVHGGEISVDELISQVETGVLLEGPELCTLDPRGERLSLLASRSREIRNGRFTGRLFSRTLSTARLSEFISNTAAVGSAARTVAFDNEGIASSAEAPHWLSKARVEAV